MNGSFRAAFARLMDPRSSLAGSLVLALLLGAVNSAIYDFAKKRLGDTLGTFVGIAVAALLIALAVVGVSFLASRRRGKVRVTGEPAPRSRGLIVLVGPERPGAPKPAREAIGYHLKDDKGNRVLQHCWLVASTDGLSVAEELAKELEKAGAKGDVVHVKDPTEARETYEEVNGIYERELVKAGLADADVIADFTGTTKPMTSGMILACAPKERAMEYLVAQRDDAGHPNLRIRPIPKLIRWEGA